MRKIKAGQHYMSRYLRNEYDSIVVILKITSVNRKIRIDYNYLDDEKSIFRAMSTKAFTDGYFFISKTQVERYRNEKMIREIIE